MSLAARFLTLALVVASVGCSLDKPTWIDAKAKSDAAANYYLEEHHNGRLYVFGTEAAYKNFQLTKELPLNYARIGGGPKGETVYFEVEAKADTLKGRLLREYERRHGVAQN
ncbi:MAG: hypothetical protein ACT4PU_09895 [Planctomycetota bacterium]